MSRCGVTALLAGAVIALALGLAVHPASSEAASIINRDARTHTLRIIEGKRPKDLQLAPGGRLDDVCMNGCIIRIDGSADKDFILEGTERVSLENDLMYYDGEVVPRERKARPN
jgi:hypothetical protein